MAVVLRQPKPDIHILKFLDTLKIIIQEINMAGIWLAGLPTVPGVTAHTIKPKVERQVCTHLLTIPPNRLRCKKSSLVQSRILSLLIMIDHDAIHTSAKMHNHSRLLPHLCPCTNLNQSFLYFLS